jgi:putative peptidoglycan lipid II flippase
VPGGVPLGPPPAVVESRPPRQPKPEPLTPMQRSRRAARSATEGDRALIWIGIVVLVLVAAVTAFFLGRTSVSPGRADSDSSAGTGPSATPQPRPLRVMSVTDIDPEGSGGENPELAALAADGDDSTSWHTLSYENTLEWGGLKDGVGLVLDLGDVRQVGAVSILFGTAPNDVEVYAAPASSESAPTSIDGLVRIGRQNDTGAEVRIATDAPPTTRYVVVWLTAIPEESPGAGTDRGVVDEIEVLGWNP